MKSLDGLALRNSRVEESKSNPPDLAIRVLWLCMQRSHTKAKRPRPNVHRRADDVGQDQSIKVSVKVPTQQDLASGHLHLKNMLI